MTELDHLHVELSGRNLIEASAGTGKTYAISSLYLRLVIEQELTPEQILVVTYTEAATEELRGRIRGRLREGLDVFCGKRSDDPFLTGLRENGNGRGPAAETAMERLDRALKSFDTASIFTIHGFCLRALQDNAFESGSLYDTELVPDQDRLLQEIVDDFWRTRFFTRPAPLLGSALRKGWAPESFVRFLKKVPANPKLEVVPQYAVAAIASLEVKCRAAFETVQREWLASRGEIEDILVNHKGLSRAADTYRPDLLGQLFDGMESFAAGDNPFELFPGFEKFTASGIAKGKKPTGTVPEHRFFQLCEELHAGVEERFLALRWELVSFCRRRLPLRKRELNVRAFDDLIHDVYGALEGENGGVFARSLGNRYRAALIDEFQDTDPIQYDIFRKIHAASGSALFLIGDPKQAIYSFRGADIFAYMEAAADVPVRNRYTLTANWRSTRPLLDALNTLFDGGRNPFLFEEIGYHPVRPGREGGAEQFLLPGADGAPLQIWSMPADGEKPPNVGEANRRIPEAVAAETARLLRQGLQGEAFVGNRPLIPADIAVIVRSHRQAGYVREALAGAGIPSVMRSDRSIFATDEAGEVLILLSALADPGNETRLRTALVTDILGRTGDDIASLLEDEQAWEECLEKFRDYHRHWVDSGFMAMSQCLLSRENVRGRLLCRPDGERRLTNLLHCFEIIHRVGHDTGLGVEGVLAWFGEKVRKEDAAEEYQIRLETDENAVRIVTVHVSKGLEYPVVFSPFLWGGARGDDDVVSCHDGFRMVKDFGSPDIQRNRILSERESLAESLRLLYVALTRAKYRCYLVAGKIADRTGRNRPETSALAYLFHASTETRTAADVVSRLAGEAGALTAAEMNEQLEKLAATATGGISVGPMPEPEEFTPPLPDEHEGEEPTCRQFTGAITSEWRVASFTSFAAHESPVHEHPDHDDRRAVEPLPGDGAFPDEAGGRTILTFPRGARAGIFLHEIFEGIDFAAYRPGAAGPLVEKLLEKHGYLPEWRHCISTMIDRVVTTPLSSPEGDFSLSDLKKGSWISELEFFFPLKFITSGIMRDCFSTLGAPYDPDDVLQLCRTLSFRPVEGMVRGFVDMVFRHNGRFYIVDWKSNHLGGRTEDYGREGMRREMVRNLYPLQYLLYTVAINRYLSLRVREYDYTKGFGGVIYAFLRGVRPESGEKFGIFRDTPSAAMINRLTDCLIRTGG